MARSKKDDDHEKTLEPEPIPSLKKNSSSTSLVSSQKERTPYRLPVRSRNKYVDSSDSRTELGTHNRNSFRTKDHDAVYRSRNKYDDQPSSSRKPIDYYDGRSEKENVFKSKYDPDLLYSELNSDSSKPTRRPIKAYRKSDNTSDRRHTTNFRLCPIDFDDTPSTSASSSSSRLNSSRPSYVQRKSLDYQRSQTQQFFDIENNNFTEENRERRLTEREEKRKEIQGLIMKYAQADDNYPKTDEQKSFNNNNGEVVGGAKIENGITENGMPAASKIRVRSRIPKAHSSIVRTFGFFRLGFFRVLLNIN